MEVRNQLLFCFVIAIAISCSAFGLKLSSLCCCCNKSQQKNLDDQDSLAVLKDYDDQFEDIKSRNIHDPTSSYLPLLPQGGYVKRKHWAQANDEITVEKGTLLKLLRISQKRDYYLVLVELCLEETVDSQCIRPHNTNQATRKYSAPQKGRFVQKFTTGISEKGIGFRPILKDEEVFLLSENRGHTIIMSVGQKKQGWIQASAVVLQNDYQENFVQGKAKQFYWKSSANPFGLCVNENHYVKVLGYSPTTGLFYAETTQTKTYKEKSLYRDFTIRPEELKSLLEKYRAAMIKHIEPSSIEHNVNFCKRYGVTLSIKAKRDCDLFAKDITEMSKRQLFFSNGQAGIVYPTHMINDEGANPRVQYYEVEVKHKGFIPVNMVTGRLVEEFLDRYTAEDYYMFAVPPR